MKSLIIFLFLFSCSAFADLPSILSSKNIIVTNHGFLIHYEGVVYTVESLTYVGEGLYKVSQPFYGQCMQCGWPRNSSGQCINKNCDR